MYCNLHNHSSYSNASVNFPDSINSVSQIVERAQQLNYQGVALTDHEMLSGCVEMYKLQSKYPDMKLILGNEIYCMSEEQFIQKRDANGDTPYYHLILIALDLTGWRQLCKLSTFAWENSFNKRGSLRRITTKEYIKEVIGEDQGHLVCCSACMGGEIAKLLADEKTREAEKAVKQFQQIFGKDNYYLEIQPNEKDTHQWASNKRVISLAKKLKIPLIATTDSHMLNADERTAHAAAKNSKFSEDAEGEDFYATAYMMDEEELRKYLRNNLTDKDIDIVFQNTMDICNRVTNYDGMLHAQIVPEIPEEYIPEFKIKHKFKQYYDKYPYFGLYAQKTEIHEAYAFYEIEEGLINKVLNTTLAPRIELYIERINNEMDIMNAIDEHNGSKLIAYYSTCKFMCDEIWKLGSPVGIGRGSAGCWEINWLLGISQINPLEMGEKQALLFSERHMNKLRLDVMADVDTDSSPMYRQRIINRFREIWGTDRLLQVATFGTLKPKAAIKRACKGLNIEDDIAEQMSILVPVERGEARPLSICLDPESSGKVPDLITEVNKYKGLKEILLRLEGVIITMGTHAGGVCPFVPQYVEQMAMTKSPSGAPQTCFNLDDAEAVGATKYDILTTSAMELIRKCCELLIRDGYIEQKNSFREAYESVIGVDNLVYDDPDLWSKITRCPQCFQFETTIGKQILAKINPTSVEELTLASSLMRLLPPEAKEKPADRYIRYRENVENFRRDCRNSGLVDEEIKILEEVCKIDGYMTIHQETLMTLSMHPKTAAYTYKEANALRKSVAKKSKKAQQEAYETWIEWCDKNNTRREFANYIWNQMFAMQFGQ